MLRRLSSINIRKHAHKQHRHSRTISFLIAFSQALLNYIAHLLIYIKCLFLFRFLAKLIINQPSPVRWLAAVVRCVVMFFEFLCMLLAFATQMKVKKKTFSLDFGSATNIIRDLEMISYFDDRSRILRQLPHVAAIFNKNTLKMNEKH